MELKIYGKNGRNADGDYYTSAWDSQISRAKSEENLAFVYAGIRNMVRYRYIIEALDEMGACTNLELVHYLGFDQPVISQRTALLFEFGIIDKIRIGKYIVHKLNYDRIEKIMNAIKKV